MIEEKKKRGRPPLSRSSLGADAAEPPGARGVRIRQVPAVRRAAAILHLLARPGVALGDITLVRSYVHALAQCRNFLHSINVQVEATASTSQAAREVAQSSEPLGAVASSLAGDLFGLEAVASDIEDHPGNATRFVVVGRESVAAPTGHDRTTIVCFQDADRPGSLYAILGRFAARDINLTKLESRPTKLGLGDYCFVIEFEGHVADDVVADCLADLQAHLTRVKFLGSYPAAGASATTGAPAAAACPAIRPAS